MKKSIKHALASATCALIAAPSAHAENPHKIQEWDISGALLIYNESDRVQAVEPVISAKKRLDTDESIALRLTLDSLTGASATGAVASTSAQTFTRPSGNGSYTTPGQQTPLDDTFHDTRAALSLSWNRPAVWGTQSVLGLNVSREFDYQSVGASASFAKGVNNNNTTFSTGIALANDNIKPVGGAPVPFAHMQAAGTAAIRDSHSKQKVLIDLIAGVTQIIDSNSLFQLNYSMSHADGYLNDAYKVISVLEPVTGAPIHENAIDPNLPTVVYENRPDTRTKHSLFGQYKRHLGKAGDVLDASYRFMLDDWGINSHTVDFKYRKALSDRKFLQPHIRYYQQGPADFYTAFFLDGDQPDMSDLSHASADYRLGELTGLTAGLEYGQVNASNSWSVALEYYLQQTTEPGGKIGELSGLSISPDVDAIMLRLLYDF